MKSGGWTQGQNPRSKQRSPFPLSSRAKPRDLQFYGPFLDTFLTESTVAQSLKKGALRRRLFGLAKITQTNTDQAKALLQAQVDALPQCQRDGGQLFIG
jgi:hypothetical protein